MVQYPKIENPEHYKALLLGNTKLETLSDNDLDKLYFIAFNRWAWHLTREGYINHLTKERAKLKMSINQKINAKGNRVVFYTVEHESGAELIKRNYKQPHQNIYLPQLLYLCETRKNHIRL